MSEQEPLETGEGGDGGAPASSKPPNKRLQQTQAQVDEVVEIMKVNLDKVLERDQKLSNLDDRADALQEGASQFEKSAATLKSKFWLQNMKMIIAIAVVVIIIIIIIIAQQMGGEEMAKMAHVGGGGGGGGEHHSQPESVPKGPPPQGPVPVPPAPPAGGPHQ